jgi:hypothetical protein
MYSSLVQLGARRTHPTDLWLVTISSFIFCITNGLKNREKIVYFFTQVTSATHAIAFKTLP